MKQVMLKVEIVDAFQPQNSLFALMVHFPDDKSRIACQFEFSTNQHS